MSFIDKWVNESEENRRLFAEEGLILEVTESIWEALERRGWSKAQLAEALHTSRANVTQLLTGSRNMTLRTLANIAFVLGCEVHTRLIDRSATKLPSRMAGEKKGTGRFV